MSKLGINTAKGFHSKVPFAEKADILADVPMLTSATLSTNGTATIIPLARHAVYLAILEGASVVFGIKNSLNVSVAIGQYFMTIANSNVTVRNITSGEQTVEGGEQLYIYKIATLKA